MRSKIAIMLCIQLFASAQGQVKIKSHLYVGAGFIRTLTWQDPDIQVETEIEQNYYTVNDNRGPHTAKHGQVRLSLVEAGLFSLGYTFLSYRRKYETNYPQVWATERKPYPLRFDYSLHAGYLQADIPTWTIQTLRAVPYVTGGIGSYYGSYKKIDFILSSPDERIYYRETGTEIDEGWAWMAGFGFVILKRGYIQFEIVDFRQKRLPVRRFFDVVIGVKI